MALTSNTGVIMRWRVDVDIIILCTVLDEGFASTRKRNVLTVPPMLIGKKYVPLSIS